MVDRPVRDIVRNRRAKFDYHLEDHVEAGISLLGSEVKSLRAGRANLLDAYIKLTPTGAWLIGCHISPYEQANRNNHDPLRERRLLLHHHEISKLRKAVAERGKTVVPTRIYLNGSRVKVEIAVGKGKKLHDKRASMKERDARRDLRERR